MHTVRRLFRLYLELGSVTLVKQALTPDDSMPSIRVGFSFLQSPFFLDG